MSRRETLLCTHIYIHELWVYDMTISRLHHLLPIWSRLMIMVMRKMRAKGAQGVQALGRYLVQGIVIRFMMF
jgi:hypothetical protein